MAAEIHRMIPPSSEEPYEGGTTRPSWLARLLARRRVRRLERLHWEHEQKFAWHVEDVIAACGLVQEDHSVAAGDVVHIPRVVEVNFGPPVSVDIHILPGQLPTDFVAHAPAIAYDLDVSNVRVIELAHALIRLELVP